MQAEEEKNKRKKTPLIVDTHFRYSARKPLVPIVTDAFREPHLEVHNLDILSHLEDLNLNTLTLSQRHEFELQT